MFYWRKRAQVRSPKESEQLSDRIDGEGPVLSDKFLTRSVIESSRDSWSVFISLKCGGIML